MAETQEPYPEGDVVGPCICGSWPGGKCLKCPRTTPPLLVQPERPWVGLKDEDMNDPRTQNFDFIYGARWAESKLKERNNG